MEKSKISINVEGGFLFCGGWDFLKSVSVGSTFIREMRVTNPSFIIDNFLASDIHFEVLSVEIELLALNKNFGNFANEYVVLNSISIMLLFAVGLKLKPIAFSKYFETQFSTAILSRPDIEQCGGEVGQFLKMIKLMTNDP